MDTLKHKISTVCSRQTTAERAYLYAFVLGDKPQHFSDGLEYVCAYIASEHLLSRSSRADLNAVHAIRTGGFSSALFWKQVKSVDDELVEAAEQGALTPDGFPFAYQPLSQRAKPCVRCAKFHLTCFVSDRTLNGKGTYKCQPCYGHKTKCENAELGDDKGPSGKSSGGEEDIENHESVTAHAQLNHTKGKQQAPPSPESGYSDDDDIPLAISTARRRTINRGVAAATAVMAPTSKSSSVLGKHPRDDAPAPRTAAAAALPTPGSSTLGSSTPADPRPSNSHALLLLAHEKAVALADNIAARAAESGSVRLSTYARELRIDLHAPPLDAASLRDPARFAEGRAALLHATREVVGDEAVERADPEVGRLLRHLRGRLEELERA